MTDRELLELAAKAGGFVNWTWRGESLFVETGHSRGNTGYYWNPLTDDGDALRLAAKLKMRIDIGGSVSVAYITDDTPHHEDFTVDPYAATRRVIVRAAAAIGKESK